ncbi:hypothetical protein [Bifidobacterium lemurum]|nr:hypothetical protein [Bifidobacterium lemurum]QOL35546.1 hypothetical protein BL8807_01335 [Bifidobacterium lemurum]
MCFCAIFCALILAAVGFWSVMGVALLCGAMVVADVPERVSARVNQGRE